MRLKRILALTAAVALLGATQVTHALGGPTAGGFASDDVEYVGFVPFEQSTSTGITIDHKRKLMYATSWKNISTYDISDPESPQLLDQEQLGFKFENEEVAVDPQGKFLLFSESLPDDILHVYDVEDPSSITKVAELPGAGDHTTSCILKCDYAYGSDGSISDLRNYKKPKVIALDTDKDSWHKLIKLQGGGHDIAEVKNGFILFSPLDEGPMYIDVRNPVKPKVLAIGDDRAPRAQRGYLWHSGAWPNAGKDRWVLMQGEENFNPRCGPNNGQFATFDTTGWKKTGTFKKVAEYRVQNGTYQDGSPAVNGLGCSAHWFTPHDTFKNGGLVAVGYYEHGTRFLDVTSAGKIKEAGWFVPYAGSTSAAYWATKDLVYAVDYTRGIDILRWTGKF